MHYMKFEARNWFKTRNGTLESKIGSNEPEYYIYFVYTSKISKYMSHVCREMKILFQNTCFI